MSLVVARKQALPGSPPASDKPTSSSVSPRRETGSPRVLKKGPPVAQKPVRGSISDNQKPGSPRKAESPQLTKKTFESVPNGSALTGSVPTGSPVASRREPVQPQAFEPVVQIVQQSPREAARKFFFNNSILSTDCFKQSAHLDFLTKLVSRLSFVGILRIYEFCHGYVLYTAASPTLTPPPDPRTTPIIPGQECVIEIPKGNTGLGLSIVGGADTLLVSCTFGTSLY